VTNTKNDVMSGFLILKITGESQLSMTSSQHAGVGGSTIATDLAPENNYIGGVYILCLHGGWPVTWAGSLSDTVTDTPTHCHSQGIALGQMSHEGLGRGLSECRYSVDVTGICMAGSEA